MDYLGVPPDEVKLPAQRQINKEELNKAAHTCSLVAPMWVIAGSLLAWSSYSIYRLNNPKKM